ncbi:MAG: hypothetical protein MHMPM18_002705 [Marteilia pararefringens]
MDLAEHDAERAFSIFKTADNTVSVEKCAEAILPNLNGIILLSNLEKIVNSFNKKALNLNEFKTCYCEAQKQVDEDAFSKIESLHDAFTDGNSEFIDFHEIMASLSSRGEKIPPAAIKRFYQPYIGSNGKLSKNFLKSEDVMSYFK